MKALILCSMTLALALGAGGALAERGGHSGHGYGHYSHYGNKPYVGYRASHYSRYPAHHYRSQHYRAKHYRAKHYRSYRHGYRHGYRQGHRHGYRHGHTYQRRSSHYYPLGAALVGSAVSYTLYHRDASVRHGTHSGDASPEVVGCHRIERYPDGSEQRVEVPLSECD